MNIQLPLFDPPSVWTPPKVSELPSWAEASRVALDIETCDPDLGDLGPGEHRDGRIIGVSFAIEDSHHAYYLPIGHALDGNMDEHVVLRYLRDQARAFKGVLVGQNLSYDLGYLRKAGVFFSPRRYADVKLAAAILDETLPSYALDAIARNMGIPGKASTGLESAALAYGLTNPKSEMWKLPARHVAPYAIRDVTLPLELMRRQERAILDCDGLDGAWNLECDVFPIMVEMREIGVPVDRAHLDKVEETAILEEQKHLDAIYHATGCRISSDDVNKKTALLPVLRYLGVKPELTATGQKRKDAGEEISDQDYKVNAALLESLDSPVGHRLLMAKKANKVRNTFVSSIRRSMTADGRIHCSLNQMKRDADDGSGTKGTVTGRMSATNPNMQQQLSRDKFWGPIWRAVFIPNPGEQWACLDFSSQEPRIAAHFALESGLPGAKEVVEEYNRNPRMDMHQRTMDLVNLPQIDRKKAKDVFLGLLYLMGDGKLCEMYLDVPTVRSEKKFHGRYYQKAGPEGQRILQKFHDMVPWAKKLGYETKDFADRNGYIQTLSGRRRRFEQKLTGGFDFTYRALNAKVQGTAADQLKYALVALKKAGMVPMLPVHDELDDSIKTVEEARERARIMEQAMPMSVPSVVDVEIGPNWAEIRKIPD